MNISKYFKNEDFKLCYVEGQKAYFTTKPISEQWGDDWDDAPYEHNAGTPYAPGYIHYITGSVKDSRDWNDDSTPKFEVLGFYYSGELITPDEEYYNSPYSVKDINNGETPWLKSELIQINAGTTFPEFINLLKKAGGEIHIPYSFLLNSDKEVQVSDAQRC